MNNITKKTLKNIKHRTQIFTGDRNKALVNR